MHLLGIIRQVDGLLGLGFLQDLRVKVWDGPFGTGCELGRDVDGRVQGVGGV